MTDVPLEHHEECACVCKDDSDWPQTCVTAANGSMRMLEMNLCRCSYLIHYHWKLTRFSFYPDVLLLIGWSRTDWNLINLPNGFDCCGIPIECSESILERPKKKITGADLDHYLWALKTIFFHSSEIRTLRHLRHFFLRSFLKFSQCGLILSWKMGASLFKYFFISISELAPAALPCSLGSSIITIKAKKGGF